jgi:predicted neuraminidase
MDQGILDLRALVQHGELFRSPADGGRVEAFIPPLGRENHAANLLELPNGDLLCCWFAGTAEASGDVAITLARLPAGGESWSRPERISDDPTRSEQNPLLFLTPQGQLWLLYTAQETRGCSRKEWEQRIANGEARGDFAMQWTAVIRRRISLDFGRSWGLVEAFFPWPSSFCRQPMLVLSNGDWLFPMYYSLPAPGHGEDFSALQLSSDQGQTWREVVIPGSRGRVQPSVLEHAPGKLLAFLRSRAADRIYLSRSGDYGRSWSQPEPTPLPNNNASIQAACLQSGRIALVFNNVSANEDPQKTVWPKVRYPLTMALSADGGLTWPHQRDLDPGDGLAGQANRGLNRPCDYPCLLQSRDGALHVAYSYHGRQCIKYLRFSEAWALGEVDEVWGEPPS